MIEIDGSMGEGGGQILRAASALSFEVGEPIRVTGIRSNRPKPGLRPQHLALLKALIKVTGGKAEGLKVGSSEISFFPGEPRGGSYEVDIGTAGSITLLAETLVLALHRTERSIEIAISGGTDVPMSPSWDHMARVLFPILNRAGIAVGAELVRRGYAPKGGGKARIMIPAFPGSSHIDLGEKAVYGSAEGLVHIGGLPHHIAERMRSAACETLSRSGLRVEIGIDEVSASAGTGITLWADSGRSIIGSDALGRVGVPAEKVASDAVGSLTKDIASGSTVDPWALDQLLPYMALSKRDSLCAAREVSSHSRTTISLIERMIGRTPIEERCGELRVIRFRT